MTTIDFNLLPWRVLHEKNRIKKFFFSLGVTLFFLLGVIFLIHGRVSKLIIRQETKIIQLKEKIQGINQLKSKENEFKNLLENFENIQKNRKENPIFLEKLSNYTPKAIYIMEITRTENRYELLGKSKSKQAIAIFMSNFSSDTYFSQVQLGEIKDSLTDLEYPNDFILTVAISGKKTSC